MKIKNISVLCFFTVILSALLATLSSCVPGGSIAVMPDWHVPTNYLGEGVSPAISGDGTVFVLFDGTQIHAYTSDGEERPGNWPFPVTEQTSNEWTILVSATEPVIGVSEHVYTGVHQRRYINNGGDVQLENEYFFVALRTDGTIVWQLNDLRAVAPPAAGLDGSIYVITEEDCNQYTGCETQYLTKISSSGQIIGRINLGFANHHVVQSPVISPEGFIYLDEEHRIVHKVDIRSADPASWPGSIGGFDVPNQEAIDTNIAIDDQGDLYFGTKRDSSRRLRRYTGDLNPAGDVGLSTWRVYGVLLSGDNNVYVVGNDSNGDGRLKGFNTDNLNTVTLTVESNLTFTGVPAIADSATGNQYHVATNSNGGVINVYNSTGEKIKTLSTNERISGSSPAIWRNGSLYVVSQTGDIYAFDTESDGLADASWPMYRADTYHSNSNQAFAEQTPWITVYTRVLSSEDELRLLRSYRDEVLVADRALGRQWVKQLYEHSSQTLDVINQHPELQQQGRQLLREYKGAIQAVLEGKPGVINDTESIAGFLDEFAKKSPQGLKELITNVKAEMLKHRAEERSFLGLTLR